MYSAAARLTCAENGTYKAIHGTHNGVIRGMMPNKAMIGPICAMTGTNRVIYGTVHGFCPKSGCLKAIRGTNKAKHGTDSVLRPDFEEKPV
jgi:hypothetical protein